MNLILTTVFWYDYIAEFLTFTLLLVNLYLIFIRDRQIAHKIYYYNNVNKHTYIFLVNSGRQPLYIRKVIYKYNTKVRDYNHIFTIHENDHIQDGDGVHLEAVAQHNDKISLPYKLESGESMYIGFEIQIANVTSKKCKTFDEFYLDKGCISLLINNKTVKIKRKQKS